TFRPDSSAAEFMRKLILHARSSQKSRSSRLIVVGSGKGGTGVTSTCAALAEAAIEFGKKAIVVDFDFATQDLSRFLQTRPFINENLRLLCDGHRPVTEEFVEHCLTPVWTDEHLYCLAPVAESDDVYNLDSRQARTFLSIFDILDSKFDVIFIDSAQAKS